MGVIDTEGKNYFGLNRIFADAFNYLLYDGEEVIKADSLKELDTTQIAIPYGNGARVPTQKYRDLLKIWSAMMDENAVYVMLGAELQDKVHYAMPVKNGLYDMIGYARQVEEARTSFKKTTDEKEAELFVEGDAIKIKLTSEEFLSGFRKADKLIPIITATVYLSADKWDGPLSLHEMLDIKDKRLLKFIPNYPINLIAPVNMEDEDFSKFHTNLGFAMNVLKYQSDKADQIIESTDHRKIDRNTAEFLNVVAKLELDYGEEEGDVDMCLAMEKRSQRDKITGAIEFMKDEGMAEQDIISWIVEKYKVTKEYVVELLAPQTA